MNTPAPVAMTPQMIALLAKSKQVMNKSLADKPITIKNTAPALSESYVVDTPIYSENDEREPIYNDYSPRPAAITPPVNFSAEHIMASRLPANVKEAMIKNPIAKPSSTGVLSQEIIEAINPNARRTAAPVPRQMVNETFRTNNPDSDLITISRSELKEIMNETLVNFLKTNYEKTLTESAITRTINLLIKEGKIGVKKKTI
jgi:hypothetical protein